MPIGQATTVNMDRPSPQEIALMGGSLWATLLGGGAVVAGIVGMASLSQATSGVGFVAFGLLLAVFARMAQSARQHRQLMSKVGSQQEH